MFGRTILIVSICFSLVLQPLEAKSGPIKKDRFYFEKKGDMVWEVHTAHKLIALTFDDGPDPIQTNQILDLLRLYNAHCTFFMVGNKIALHPEIARRVLAEGHEAGNHTYTHKVFKLPASEDVVRHEIESTEKEIFVATGVDKAT